MIDQRYNTYFVDKKNKTKSKSYIEFAKNICLHVFIQFINNIAAITKMIVLLTMIHSINIRALIIVIFVDRLLFFVLLILEA